MRVLNFTSGLLMALVTSACAGGTAAPAAAPSDDTAPSSTNDGSPVSNGSADSVDSAGSADSEAEAGLHAVEVAVDAAQAVADAWDSEKARVEEVTLTLRVRVVGKTASVKGSGQGANLMDDLAGAAPADITIDLDLEQGVALAEGKTTLKNLAESGKIKVDNSQGLERFLQFVK